MKPKVQVGWELQSRSDINSKPKEGLALLLERTEPTAVSVDQVAALGPKAPSTTDGTDVENSYAEELQRSLGYILDASLSVHGPDAYPLVNGRCLDLEAVQTYLKERLDVVSPFGDSLPALSHEFLLKAGKVGPPVVQMQRGNTSGEIKFDSTGLHLESLSNFSSVRANACVFKGKWMYEVTLGTAGIQQLGWAPLNCPFTNEEGVGDAPDSYAIDGKRIRKWNRGSQQYGQAWVPGDVIGCGIDLDNGTIEFHRNGVSLGVAFSEVRRLQPGLGYFPALSLSHGERCELNFGGRPFTYPNPDYLPFQGPPLVSREVQDQLDSAGMDLDHANSVPQQGVAGKAKYLLACLWRLVVLHTDDALHNVSNVDAHPIPVQLSKDDQILIAYALCHHLGPLLLVGEQPSQTNRSFGRREEARPSGGFVVRGCLLPFLLCTLRKSPPHDHESLDLALDLLLICLDQHELEGVVPVLMDGLAYSCRVAMFDAKEPAHSGPYQHLALACRLVRRKEILRIWWASQNFESTLEGLLTRKSPNKNDLEELFPKVWWPGCHDQSCSEAETTQAVQALAGAIAQVEELQVNMCRQLLVFVPPRPAVPSIGTGLPSIAQGGIFGAFLQSLICKNRGANRNIPPPGLSDNSVLVSAFFVLLRILSEGLTEPTLSEEEASVPWSERTGNGYFQSGAERKFPVSLFLRSDALYIDLPRLGGTFSHLVKASPASFPLDYADVRWEDESDDEEGNAEKGSAGRGNDGEPPSRPDKTNFPAGSSSAERPMQGLARDASGGSTAGDSKFRPETVRSLSEAHAGEASSSAREPLDGAGGPLRFEDGSHRRTGSPDAAAREEELVDVLVLLYHLGVTSNFKQASQHLQNQIQAINQLDECDRQIRANEGGHLDELLQHLREARTVYRDDVVDNVRHCTWYRVSLFAKWKQESIYSTCVWIVQLLLASSKRGVLFSYVPEFYVETLVDSFHALRRSDPPFAPPASVLRQGLSSLVTFMVAHFNDPRIANPDMRDVLLQSISVLLQYREYVAAFERNRTAREQLPAALLAAFDKRFWIPVSHILLRLCKGSGFGGARPSATSLSPSECSSPVFQKLLREKCEEDQALLGTFVNRLFNTLNWTITEFSVTVKEMLDHLERHQVPELQQRKCSIMFELSCNLLRILEFLAGQLPHVFLGGPEMNLTRLCELLLFVLSHATTGPDAHLFDSAVRLHGVPWEKLRRELILGPLVGILIHLGEAQPSVAMPWDLARAIAQVDPSPACLANFDYLVAYDWNGPFRGDPSLSRLPMLRALVRRLRAEVEGIQQASQVEAARREEGGVEEKGQDEDEGMDVCSICYASTIDTTFVPCKHSSCQQCISRHLLNNSRCFFCNAVVEKLTTSSPDNTTSTTIERPTTDESGPTTD